MKKHRKAFQQSRRDFIRQSACASLGVTGLVNALAQSRLMAAAASTVNTNDYKAMVCVFLGGGNDSNNMLIPLGLSEPRTDYEAGRGALALDGADLHPLNLDALHSQVAFTPNYGGDVPTMGVHPNAKPMADLFNSGKLSFVCNVGTLAYPVPSRSDFNNETVPLPPRLFSHSDQQTQWQSSVADKPFTSGWGGRAAELLHASYNDPLASKISLSISLNGISSFQVGTNGTAQQYSMSPEGAISLNGFHDGEDPYGIAFQNDGSHRIQVDEGRRYRSFVRIMGYTHQSLMEEEFRKVVETARSKEGVVSASLLAADASLVNFGANFMSADSDLGDQLKMVSRLIAGRSALGNNRQIFFCQVGGYDSHKNHLTSHARLMEELSEALSAFQGTMDELGVAEDVTLFTASDFARTLTPNGAGADDGCDHAWGQNSIVMGGAVDGGKLFGHFPSLKLGDASGSIDSKGDRGRWIPSVGVDQYGAVLANWMGVGSNEMEAIFPNLSRFDNPIVSGTPNLAFL